MPRVNRGAEVVPSTTTTTITTIPSTVLLSSGSVSKDEKLDEQTQQQLQQAQCMYKDSSTSSGSNNNTFVSSSKGQSNSLLLPIGIGVGINRASLVRMILTLDGRDKFTKLVQYLCRFLAHYYSTSTSSSTSQTSDRNVLLIKQFNAMKVSLTNSRKAYRLGKSFIEINKLCEMDFIQPIRQFCSNGCCDKNQEDDNNKKSNNEKATTNHELYKIMATTIKTIGLCGFWACDNMSYLTMLGILDQQKQRHHSSVAATQNTTANRIQSLTVRANRFYFVSALSGLYVNICSYREFFIKHKKKNTTTTTTMSLDMKKSSTSDDDDQENHNNKDTDTNSSNDENEQQQQIHDDLKLLRQERILQLAIVKSCCDLLVFSNNPGIDLWYQWRQVKLNEYIHCIAGMISSITVMYNQYQ